MRRLLNTLYVTNEDAYLSLEGEDVVCLIGKEKKLRLPLDNVEAIVCFGYRGCSPALMGKCADNCISLSFISPQGKFLARVNGKIHGNVFLRVAQLEKYHENALSLAQNSMAAKFSNALSVIRRSRHDIPALREDADINGTVDVLQEGIDKVYHAESLDELLGIEGYCAKSYFASFGKLFTSSDVDFTVRSKRPPLDPPNAVLSFLYTLYTAEFASALETVGLDSYIGFYHALRSGRSSLACDLVEEARCHVERMTLTLFNLGILSDRDFDKQLSGAVWLNDEGRKKVITKWQEKKRTDMTHPYLKQKIPFGLLPYVQSNLMAKYVRSEIEEYPCYLNR